MATRPHQTYQNGLLISETTIEIPDEQDREEKISDALDARLDLLLDIRAGWSGYTTGAQIRQVVYLLLTTVIWLLRIARRRFDAAEDI